jgi:uncharacterized membrane protein
MQEPEAAPQSALRQAIIKIAAVDAFATLVFGLGLVVKLGLAPGLLPPPLDHAAVATGMVAFGGALMAVCAVRIALIAKRHAAAQRRRRAER